MSTQSGITASDELRDAWSSALLPDSDIAVLILNIVNEAITVTEQKASSGSFDTDLDSVLELLPAQEPAYVLVKSPEKKWMFYSYVPDAAPVRSKMLYASSRATLVRVLGDDHIALSIFATDKSDLGAEAYRRHEKHASSAAPLTTREQEMSDIRAAEAAHADEVSQAPRTIVHSQPGEDDPESVPSDQIGGGRLGLVWSDEAVAAVRTWDKAHPITFEIEDEKIVLSKHQPTELSLLKDLPSYTLYCLNGQNVFIYCCPSNSPVKNRMLYSLSVKAFVHLCGARLDLPNVKRLESSDPSEVTDEWITSQLSSNGTDTSAAESSATDSDKKPFTKPRRPGRK